MPLWQTPEAWLQLLVNQEDFGNALPRLMSVNWAMCEAVLRCMDKWRLRMHVRRTIH
jgi:hypothetical protein